MLIKLTVIKILEIISENKIIFFISKYSPTKLKIV